MSESQSLQGNRDFAAFELIGTLNAGGNVYESHTDKASAIASGNAKCESFEVRRISDDTQVYVEYPRTVWV